jgi:hypothetical protein
VDIVLTRTTVQKPFFKRVGNRFVDSIAITASGADAARVKIVPAAIPIAVEASKTIDGFGLRLRITPQKSATPSHTPTATSTRTTTNTATPLATRPDTGVPGWRYWAVMGILLFLLLMMWFARRYAMKKRQTPGDWLMPKEVADALGSEAVIRYQKPLDGHNRLLLLEFGGKQYLLVVGNGNLLLDVYTHGHIEDEESFEMMFEQNKKRLDRFLKESHQDAYEAFKANASKEEHL